MARSKKRHLTSFGKKIFFLLIVIIIVIFILCVKGFDFNRITNSNKDIDTRDYSEYITDLKESDDDVINTKFANGISVDEYKKILNQKTNYVKKNGTYKQINYDFDDKLHYSDIESMLYNMNNSDIVKLEIIGKSVDNRNIYGIEIGKGSKVLYLDANIHAAEIASTLMLTKFFSEIVNSYESNDKEIISILNNIKIAAIVTINPDGYEVYNYGVESLNNKDLWWYQVRDTYDFSNMKSNANGVDINRNFPTQNAGMYYKSKSLINSVALEKSTNKLKYFGGEVLGSEPETQAAMYFMLKHYKNIYVYINMHSQGRVIYAGKPNLSDEFNEITINFANKVSKINNYIVNGLSSEEVGEGNDGSATDFIAEIANGFKFSTKTNRLSTNKYIDNSCELLYNFPVITLETIKTYTDDPSYFKDEYYNYGIRSLLYKLLDSNF